MHINLHVVFTGKFGNVLLEFFLTAVGRMRSHADFDQIVFKILLSGFHGLFDATDGSLVIGAGAYKSSGNDSAKPRFLNCLTAGKHI